MLKSLKAYSCLFDQVSRAVDPQKTGLKKAHPKLRDKLDECFISLYSDWHAYKEDLGLPDEDFNKVEDESSKPTIHHNDEWFTNLQEEYYALCDKSDDILEGQATPVTVDDSVERKETKMFDLEAKKKEDQQKRLSDLLLSQIEAETDAIKIAIQKLETEVKGFTAGTIAQNKAQSLKASERELANRINLGLQDLVLQCLPLLEKGEAVLKNTLRIQFVTQNRNKLRSILEEIEEKTEMKASSTSAAVTGRGKAEQTFLKKCDPPKFDGDEVKYPDFKRKWIANVSSANLSAESELDRLSDNVPNKAAKMLFGEVSIGGAWAILDKMYGNKTIIANKLKTQLKEIKGNGKEDHDIVINLAIYVKTIEKRLRELNLEKMLKYDDEYLSAVFKALPSNEKIRWLDVDKSGYEFEWDGMMIFLEEAREKSTNTKVLLSCYGDQSEEKQITCRKCGNSGHKKTNCPGNFNAVKAAAVVSDDDSSDDEDAEKSRKERDKAMKKRVREMCGKCSICNKRHTFTRKKDNQEWPSDRFITCPQFHKNTPKERALQVEKVKGCARCTSWTHQKSDCRVPKGKCGLGKDGNKSQSDHSRMLCGSGVAYCGNLKMMATSSDSTSSSETSSSDSSSSPDSDSEKCFPDLDAETLLSFQDIKLLGVEDEQRSCMDGGSNRCLIRNDFAKEQNFRSQKIKYRLKAMGTPEKVEETEFFIFYIQDNHGVVSIPAAVPGLEINFK